MKAEPGKMVEQIEAKASLPEGATERFNGYGVMGLPFESGHVLALRRFPATSIGPGYTSVWHRNPQGEWVFYTNAAAWQSCPRFFGAILADAIETEITLSWATPFRLNVTMPAISFYWEVEMGRTTATVIMNVASRVPPSRAWLSPSVLSAMAAVAGPILGVGHIGLHGRVPNGQNFIANPRIVWAVVNSSARLRDADFGHPDPLPLQAHLGDFWIPQRGMFAIGTAYFDLFKSDASLAEDLCSWIVI